MLSPVLSTIIFCHKVLEKSTSMAGFPVQSDSGKLIFPGISRRWVGTCLCQSTHRSKLFSFCKLTDSSVLLLHYVRVIFRSVLWDFHAFFDLSFRHVPPSRQRGWYDPRSDARYTVFRYTAVLNVMVLYTV